jgi:hypothetical protein
VPQLDTLKQQGGRRGRHWKPTVPGIDPSGAGGQREIEHPLDPEALEPLDRAHDV